MSENPHDFLRVINDFYPATLASRLFQTLSEDHPWPENRYQVAGRFFTLPRQQTWHADPGIVYSYNNNFLVTREWTSLLSEIRKKVEVELNYVFNAVLVNNYRNGHDYVGWHADDEIELGEQALIASLSLGGTRPFLMRHKQSHQQQRIELFHGSLIVMLPGFQQHFLHTVPKDPDIDTGRINLTFRKVMAQPK